MPHIILLNGTSSSGKSTLAKALQNQFDVPYLHIGIDTFVFMLPKAYLNPPLWHQVFEYHWQPDGSLVITTGPLGHQLMSAMHAAVAGLARSGFNIIVDHVLLESSWLDECVERFGDFQVTFVGVRCPLEILEQRERARKDRTIGQAQAQFDVVHAGKQYDVEVDTSLGSPPECAAQIRVYMDGKPESSVFERLKTQNGITSR